MCHVTSLVGHLFEFVHSTGAALRSKEPRGQLGALLHGSSSHVHRGPSWRRNIRSHNVPRVSKFHQVSHPLNAYESMYNHVYLLTHCSNIWEKQITVWNYDLQLLCFLGSQINGGSWRKICCAAMLVLILLGSTMNGINRISVWPPGTPPLTGLSSTR